MKKSLLFLALLFIFLLLAKVHAKPENHEEQENTEQQENSEEQQQEEEQQEESSSSSSDDSNSSEEENDSATTPAVKPSLTFAVIGDYGKVNDRSTAVSESMRRVCLDHSDSQSLLPAGFPPCSFIISTGDNVYPDGIQSVHDPQLKTKFEKFFNIPLRFYMVLGNHDWRGKPRPQIEYTKLQKRWYLPNYFYSERINVGESEDANRFAVQFAFIDTNPFIEEYYHDKRYNIAELKEQDTKKQLHWLDHLFTQSKDKDTNEWRIVVGHHPVYSVSRHGDTKELRTTVKPLLEKHGVHAYMCGHDHNLQHIQEPGKKNGIEYFLSGGGQDVDHKYRSNYASLVKFFHPYSGFMLVNIDVDEMKVMFFNQEGKQVYHHSFPKSS